MATTEDHDPTTVEQALVLGRQLWDEGRFFEAHECLEVVWHAAPRDDEDLWQGVIQVAVAGVHLQRDNDHGAAALFERSAQRLAGYPDRHRGIEVGELRAFCERAVARVRAGDAAAVTVPPFPAAPGGAWFTADPAALQPPSRPTPVPDEPAWRAAGRPRSPRRRDGP